MSFFEGEGSIDRFGLYLRFRALLEWQPWASKDWDVKTENRPVSFMALNATKKSQGGTYLFQSIRAMEARGMKSLAPIEAVNQPASHAQNKFLN